MDQRYLKDNIFHSLLGAGVGVCANWLTGVLIGAGVAGVGDTKEELGPALLIMGRPITVLGAALGADRGAATGSDCWFSLSVSVVRRFFQDL